MNQIVYKFMILLLIFSLGVAGASYWIGNQASQHYEHLTQTTVGQLQMQKIAYQRGVFRSHASTRLALDETALRDQGVDDLGFADLNLNLDHQIYHGPWPVMGWLDGQLPLPVTAQPVQAVIRTVLNREQSQSSLIAPLVRGGDPLVVVSELHLDGSSTHTVTLHPVEVRDYGLLSLLAFSGGKGYLNIRPDTVSGQLQFAALQVAITGLPPSFVLQGVHALVDQKVGNNELWIGTSEIQLARLRLDHLPISFESLELNDLYLKTTIQEQEVQITSQLQLMLNQLRMGEVQQGHGQITFTIAKLDGPTLAQFQRLSGLGDESVLLTLLSQWQQLLKHHPKITVRTDIQTPQGPMQAHLQAVIRTPDEGLSLTDWTQLLASAEADLTIGKPLLEMLLTEIVKQQLKAAAAQHRQVVDEQLLTQQATLQAQQQLGLLVAQQLLQLEGEVYRARAIWQNDQILVNGLLIPLAF